jgi:hypothetical protein
LRRRKRNWQVPHHQLQLEGRLFVPEQHPAFDAVAVRSLLLAEHEPGC